jgi:hypothetical protein
MAQSGDNSVANLERGAGKAAGAVPGPPDRDHH